MYDHIQFENFTHRMYKRQPVRFLPIFPYPSICNATEVSSQLALLCQNFPQKLVSAFQPLLRLIYSGPYCCTGSNVSILCYGARRSTHKKALPDALNASKSSRLSRCKSQCVPSHILLLSSIAGAGRGRNVASITRVPPCPVPHDMPQSCSHVHQAPAHCASYAVQDAFNHGCACVYIDTACEPMPHRRNNHAHHCFFALQTDVPTISSPTPPTQPPVPQLPTNTVTAQPHPSSHTWHLWAPTARPAPHIPSYIYSSPAEPPTALALLQRSIMHAAGSHLAALYVDHQSCMSARCARTHVHQLSVLPTGSISEPPAAVECN